jgi:hypothetical protein
MVSMLPIGRSLMVSMLPIGRSATCSRRRRPVGLLPTLVF